MKGRSRTKLQEKQKNEAKVHAYTSRLTFEDKLTKRASDAARQLTKAVIMIDPWHPLISPSVLMKQEGEFTLTLRNFLCEIDQRNLYDVLLGISRKKLFKCVSDVHVNFGVGTITLEVSPTRANGPGVRLSRRQRTGGRSRDGHDESLGSSHADVPISAATNGLMRRLDLTAVAVHERAEVVEVVAAIHSRFGSGSMGQTPTIAETADGHSYKILFRGQDKEVSLRDLYNSALASGHRRNSVYGAVSSIGMEPSVNAMAVRLNKKQAVRLASSRASRAGRSDVRASEERDAVMTAIQRRVKHVSKRL